MKYKFSAEQYAEIKSAQKRNWDKQIEKHLKVLAWRYEGTSIKETGKATGFGYAHITSLIRKYYGEGLQAISEKHYTGNRRNMSIDKEVAFLEPYCQRSEQGTRTGCPRNRSGLCEESRTQHWQQSDLSNAEATWLAKSHASEQASETSQRGGDRLLKKTSNKLIQMIWSYVRYYNTRRVQQNFGLLTPKEIELCLATERKPEIKVIYTAGYPNLWLPQCRISAALWKIFIKPCRFASLSFWLV